jgi:hypothetical protein
MNLVAEIRTGGKFRATNDGGAPLMNSAHTTKLMAGLLVFLAMPDLALAQDISNAPTVSHPSSQTVSPRLSDLPDAHWHGSPMDLKIHPRPLLPPLPEEAARPSTSRLLKKP